MPLIKYGDGLLVVDGQLAGDTLCCCPILPCPCCDPVPNPSATISGGTFTLSGIDAHPDCSDSDERGTCCNYLNSTLTVPAGDPDPCYGEWEKKWQGVEPECYPDYCDWVDVDCGGLTMRGDYSVACTTIDSVDYWALTLNFSTLAVTASWTEYIERDDSIVPCVEPTGLGSTWPCPLGGGFPCVEISSLEVECEPCINPTDLSECCSNGASITFTLI